MNQRISQVFTGIAVAFVAIVALLTYWQIINAGHLRNKSYNNQTAYYEQRIKRGLIRTSDGVILARNSGKQGPNGDTVYERSYPLKRLAAHVVGYSTREKSRTGIERSFNDYLTGSTRGLGSIAARLDSKDVVTGDSLKLTLNARAQRIAERALGSERGAVVALEPDSGRVLVMASSPGYDLNQVDQNFDLIKQAGGEPLNPRAIQGRYAPGSTFKLVTLAAALENEVVQEDSTFPGGCRYEVKAGPPINNFGAACARPHDLTFALTQSVNVTFAQLGEEVGDEDLREQMRRFGFEDTRHLEDLPGGEQLSSGLFQGEDLLKADQGVDVARVAIGQERLQVTPLQMAMVVAAIANGGTLMKPYLVEQITDAQGRSVRKAEASILTDDAISKTTASTMTEMMKNVVREGTGTAAALQGIDVAGKTGTADTGSGNQVWFVAFAPADNPKVAIAVTLEGQPPGATGGVVAAPIAADVLASLLGGSR